jgi:hypothetical protein
MGRKNQSVRRVPEPVRTSRPQPTVQSVDAQEEEDESIDIPAFLRRGANR